MSKPNIKIGDHIRTSYAYDNKLWGKEPDYVVLHIFHEDEGPSNWHQYIVHDDTIYPERWSYACRTELEPENTQPSYYINHYHDVDGVIKSVFSDEYLILTGKTDHEQLELF